jgi:hypothetical protein
MYLTLWSRNQPKSYLKGRVLCECETSSLVRLDHSCVRNAVLELVHRALQTITGGAYANGVFVVAEGLDMLKLGAIATSGRWSHQATCHSWKGTLVGWKSESWTQKSWNSFGWWPLRLEGGGITFDSVRTAKKTQHFTITKINWLMLF